MNELSLVLDATLTLGLALLAWTAARSSSAAVRAHVLTCAFAVLLALPLVSLAFSSRTIAIPIPQRLAVPQAAPVDRL